MENDMFFTDGQGKWTRVEHAEQCPENSFLMHECQGIKGHKGVHWSFSPCGDFLYCDNKEDPSEDGCSGTIPVGHKNYITPKEMRDNFYLQHSHSYEITDKEEISRLESDECEEIISRPLTKPIWPELVAELQKTINDIKSTSVPWWKFWHNKKPKIR